MTLFEPSPSTPVLDTGDGLRTHAILFGESPGARSVVDLASDGADLLLSEDAVSAGSAAVAGSVFDSVHLVGRVVVPPKMLGRHTSEVAFAAGVAGVRLAHRGRPHGKKQNEAMRRFSPSVVRNGRRTVPLVARKRHAFRWVVGDYLLKVVQQAFGFVERVSVAFPSGVMFAAPSGRVPGKAATSIDLARRPVASIRPGFLGGLVVPGKVVPITHFSNVCRFITRRVRAGSVGHEGTSFIGSLHGRGSCRSARPTGFSLPACRFERAEG